MKKTKTPQKPTQQPPQQSMPIKRKRARKAAQRLDEEKRYSDEDLIAIHRRIEAKDMPRIMAIAARELGHVAARPRDFYCGCIPHARTGQPVCTGGSKGGHTACPLPGRLIDGETDEDARDDARFTARIERIVDRRYQTRPRG